jgi:hypothetical protein
MPDALPLDQWVSDRIQEWLTYRGIWYGEVTLRFGESGIELLREKRITHINSVGECGLWGNIQYGRTSVLIHDGQQRIIEEERTTRRPRTEDAKGAG